LAEATSFAGVAGAAGTASWAGAPWPIDAGAPAFGLSMSAAALSFLPLASAAQGGLLSNDQLIAAHAQEMILPPPLSRGIQNLISSTGGNISSTNIDAGGGNTINRLQFQNVQNISSAFNAGDHVEDMYRALQSKLRRRGYNI
jgi:hypothetical protein